MPSSTSRTSSAVSGSIGRQRIHGRRSTSFSTPLEVRSAVVYGSVIVVLVFLPVFFLEGLAGSFFRPLALAYVLAISASLLVALTVTPALSLMLLPQSEHQRDAPLVAWLKARYRRILPNLVAAPRRALSSSRHR